MVASCSNVLTYHFPEGTGETPESASKIARNKYGKTLKWNWLEVPTRCAREV
jgi:hypothetical protein